MARDEAPPFSRGETFYNGATIDSSNLGGQNLEGKIWVFEDEDLTPGKVGAKVIRTGRPVKCMCCRNVSGTTQYGKFLINLQSGGADGRYYCGRFDGLSYIAGQRAYPIDEYLPSTGVPNNDLCWIVIEGPAVCMTPLDGAADNVFSVGSMVAALTAATSGATTAGRVYPQDLTGATSPLGNQIQNRIGHALSAATTANTNSGLLVEVGKW